MYPMSISNMREVKDLAAGLGVAFIDSRFCYKSLATQILQDDGLAPIVSIVLKFLLDLIEPNIIFKIFYMKCKITVRIKNRIKFLGYVA